MQPSATIGHHPDALLVPGRSAETPVKSVHAWYISRCDELSPMNKALADLAIYQGVLSGGGRI